MAIDLLLRLPGTLLHQYEDLVPTNPVFYKACTSGVAYTFGDFISQVYQVNPSPSPNPSPSLSPSPNPNPNLNPNPNPNPNPNLNLSP